MKLPKLAIIASAVLITCASPSQQPSASADPAAYAILDRGPHHRVWARVSEATNQPGATVLTTNVAYVELAAGLHYARKSPSGAVEWVNRVTNMVDAAGATAYSFNSAGQLLWENGPWAQDTVSYSYQHRLRGTAAVEAPNASPCVVGYGYDSMKRLTNVSSPAGAFGYSYTGAGQNLAGGSLVGGIALPGGSRIDHTYDSVGRLLSTALKNSQLATLNSHAYTYNVGNQRTRQTRTHGDYVDYTYDPAGQLIRALGSEEGGSPSRLQEQHAYVYDRAGNLEYRTNYSLVQGFGVNSLNQLTNGNRLTSSMVVAGSASGTPTNVLVWGTGLASGSAQLHDDGTWARSGATLADGNNTYTAVAQDALGRVDTNSSTCYLPVSTAFAYDANGNLTNDGRRVFYYDDENQLIAVLVSNAWKSEFTYDGKMRRRERRECAWSGGTWVTNTLVRYIYDGNLVIQERHFDPQLSTVIPQQAVSYTRGKDLSGSLEGAGGIGGLLARSSSADVLSPNAYYHADRNGNVTALVSTNQVLVAHYVYDPYGSILGQSGPLADANLFRFSSKEFHENSGLVYYLYRFYEPSLQRWINRDPIEEEGGYNLYSITANAPLFYIDPHGADLIAIPLDRFDPGGNPDRSRQFNRGCIGLCSWYQSEGCGKPKDFPENASNTECFSSKSQAEAYKCSDSKTPFIFAKQGNWKDGKPPKPKRGGRVPNDSIGNDRGHFNYVACIEGSYYWMDHAFDIGWPMPNIYIRNRPPSPGGSYPNEIWCVTCKCKGK